MLWLFKRADYGKLLIKINYNFTLIALTNTVMSSLMSFRRMSLIKLDVAG